MTYPVPDGYAVLVRFAAAPGRAAHVAESALSAASSAALRSTAAEVVFSESDPGGWDPCLVERLVRAGVLVSWGDYPTPVAAYSAAARPHDLLVLAPDAARFEPGWDHRLASGYLAQSPDGQSVGLCETAGQAGLFSGDWVSLPPLRSAHGAFLGAAALARTRGRLVGVLPPFFRDADGVGAFIADPPAPVGPGPDPALSVLICHVSARAELLRPLLAEIRRQVSRRVWRRAGRPADVEVRVDAGAGPIGAKRNRLLAAARGRYVAFVDDDDWVSPVYVDRVLGALEAYPGVDCLPLRGVITRNGFSPRPFVHDLSHTRWWDDGRTYFRPPNHLNAVRRDLALATGFPETDSGEDRDYSERLLTRLSTQGTVGPEPLYWYWFRSKK